MNIRVRAVVCLISFCLGLLSAGVGPVLAQSTMVSPEARASDPTLWQNPYYRAMNTPYYNPSLAYYNPYGTTTSTTMTNTYTSVGSSTLLGNQSQTGAGYYNPMTDSRTNPYAYDQRYAGTYGNRYQPGYYGYTTAGTTGYQLPGIIGAVAGLAIGASCFGWMGALIGGVGGYFLGDIVGKWLLPNNLGYNNAYGTGYYPQSKVPLISGLIGAGIGAFMLSSMGMVGMVLGGLAGFMVARMAVRLIAPELYYYGFQRPGMYNTTGTGAYYYAPGTTPQAGTTVPQAADTTTVKASDTNAPLSTLQEEFYQSMREYKDALVGGDDAAKEAARQDYVAKKQAYDAAKAAAAQ